MVMQLLPVNILQLMYIGTALFSALLLWPRGVLRGLSVLLLILAVLMGFNFSEEVLGSREVWLVTPVFTLAIGPGFYIFVRQLVFAETGLPKGVLWHFLPSLLALPFTGFPQGVIALGTLSQLLYILLLLRLIHQHQRVLTSQHCDSEPMQLLWVRRIVIAFILVAITDLIRLNLQPYLTLGLAQYWYFIQQGIGWLLALSTVYLGLHQPELYQDFAQWQPQEDNTAPEQQTDALALSLFQHLDPLIQQQQLYLQPRLSLSDIAEQSGLSVKQVSWGINQGSGQRFNDYINGLRIQYFQQQWQTGEFRNHSILDMAYACGFNAKSSFNSVFKRNMGMTPSQFIAKG